MDGLQKLFNFAARRFYHSTTALCNRKKFALSYPKGGPFPPEKPTVAYWPLPKHLDAQAWHYHQTSKPGSRVLRYPKMTMQNDARRRETCAYYAPLRSRLQCLKMNTYLPDELRLIAAEEVTRLPRASCRTEVRKMCVVTGRARGKRPRWRMSRIVFRKIADHGKMSGIERAYWDGGTQGMPVSLEKQTRKKKH